MADFSELELLLSSPFHIQLPVSKPISTSKRKSVLEYFSIDKWISHVSFLNMFVYDYFLTLCRLSQEEKERLGKECTVVSFISGESIYLAEEVSKFVYVSGMNQGEIELLCQVSPVPLLFENVSSYSVFCLGMEEM